MKFTKKEAVIFFSFLLLLLIPLTSAEILLSQTETLYNLGDEFKITITLSPKTQTSDFLTTSLICGDKKIEIYKSPQTVQAAGEKTIDISANLDDFLVQGAGGECYIKASYGDEDVSSQKFEVTKEAIVTLTIEGIMFGPGDTVQVNGNAEKLNGDPLNGFVEVSVPDIDFSSKSTIKDGVFSLTFNVPEDAPSGSYEIEARAYERDANEKIINEGKATEMIRIKQVIKDLGIALSAQSVMPKDGLSYSVVLYDQAREHANADVSVNVYKPGGSLYEQKIIRADESFPISLSPSSPPGYWKIEAKSGDLITTKQFLVEEYKDLSFTLQNKTLVIENMGNVPYTGPIEISIGDESEIKDVKDLAVGESVKFNLKAPSGEYLVEVSDGSDRQKLGSTFLTGRAISVQEDGVGGALLSSLWIILGLLVILVLAVVALYYFKKLKKNKISPTPMQKMAIPLKTTTTSRPMMASPETDHLIDKGEKQDASIIALKIKNLSSVENTEAMGTVDSALWKAKEAGAKIYADNDYRVIILAPVLTKDKENDVKAVNVARTMERILSAHNRRFAAKIEFGLGVNAGTLIVESDGDKFRFMSLNNIIANTKRISEISDGETLLSEALHKRTIGKIKTVKVPDKNLWKVEKVVDRSAYAEHVHSLTKHHSLHSHHSQHHKPK